jgi:penicillin-binding protein 1B
MTKRTSQPHSPEDPNSTRRSRGKRPSLGKALASWLGFTLLSVVSLSLLALAAYTLYLDSLIRVQFDGKRWSLPARVYARPLELFQDMKLSAKQFERELTLLHYRALSQPQGPGTYSKGGESFEVITRDFAFWDGSEMSQHVRVAFKGDNLLELNNLNGQEKPGLLRMEPAEIAAIYPAHNEDRILVRRADLPPVLVDTLIAMEDRSFYSHFGVDFKAISRAFFANLKAGRTVQGGSTLTQQLVKNFFLSNERTLTRKLNEMLMALLVEWHYRKDEILEAYSNEVYLGQDGKRAIHGLGLASYFYFGRPLTELNLHHVALLVGLIRGPSYYDPRRHPERAMERRALVLDMMVEQGLISSEDAAIGKQQPLDVPPQTSGGITPYPAFVDLVRRQLREDYREEDLTSEGLKIFSTLDPQVQAVAEQTVTDGLPVLEKKARIGADKLQGAAIVTDTQTGEVLAMVGGRDVHLAGFNRVLDAKRPLGSLLKPAVYLTALENPERYTLATLLDDSTPVIYADSSGKWSPANYDKHFHGRVMLQDALAHSYNIATARLGLDLDVLRVIGTLRRLGIKHDFRPYPSLLLGAVDLAPLEVAQMYQTFASGGFRIPLRAIREVAAADGEPLRRYPLKVEKAIEPGPAYLITKAMQRVVKMGTAKAINQKIPAALGIAGKTGTTDELRDSWFAGFSGNRMAVVWLGRDDNHPIGLSGANGAMPVWIDLMSDLNLEPLALTAPPNIEEVLIDSRSGLRANRNCGAGKPVPFLEGSAPRSRSSCGEPFFYTHGESIPEISAVRSDDQGSAGSDSGVYARPKSPDSVPSQRAPESDPISDFFKRLSDR